MHERGPFLRRRGGGHGRPIRLGGHFGQHPVAVIGLSELPAAMKEETGHAALYEHTRNPFDLEAGPLLRITLDAVAADPDVSLSGLEPR